MTQQYMSQCPYGFSSVVSLWKHLFLSEHSQGKDTPWGAPLLPNRHRKKINLFPPKNLQGHQWCTAIILDDIGPFLMWCDVMWCKIKLLPVQEIVERHVQDKDIVCDIHLLRLTFEGRATCVTYWSCTRKSQWIHTAAAASQPTAIETSLYQ